MILELGRRCSFLPSACCNCSYKEGIHLRMAFGDKTEVNGIRIGPPLFEPEEEASVISEAFKVWVTIVAFIVQKICDPERLESLGIKRDRTRKITHGQFHQLASAGRAVGSHLDLCPLAGHDAAGLGLYVRRARALAVADVVPSLQHRLARALEPVALLHRDAADRHSAVLDDADT